MNKFVTILIMLCLDVSLLYLAFNPGGEYIKYCNNYLWAFEIFYWMITFFMMLAAVVMCICLYSLNEKLEKSEIRMTEKEKEKLDKDFLKHRKTVATFKSFWHIFWRSHAWVVLLFATIVLGDKSLSLVWVLAMMTTFIVRECTKGVSKLSGDLTEKAVITD